MQGAHLFCIMVSCVIIIIYHNIIIIEIMCTINVMSLNHPRNHPPHPHPAPALVCGRIIFHETSPWCPKVGDCCS